nr:hypothetical protein [Providencia rustigianii]
MSKGAATSEATYVVVANGKYDGFYYNVNDVVKYLGESAPRIHFDEAWYAYACFLPYIKIVLLWGRIHLTVPLCLLFNQYIKCCHRSQ